MAGLNKTPGANRLHIGFFGKRNSGKSALINAFVIKKFQLSQVNREQLLILSIRRWKLMVWDHAC